MGKLQIKRLGKVGRGGISPQLNKIEIRKYVLSSRVTF